MARPAHHSDISDMSDIFSLTNKFMKAAENNKGCRISPSELMVIIDNDILHKLLQLRADAIKQCQKSRRNTEPVPSGSTKKEIDPTGSSAGTTKQKGVSDEAAQARAIFQPRAKH